jgi:glycosyltransferase involved in cell wall biosynthesis
MNRAAQFVPQGPWVRVGRLGGFYNLKNYRNNVEYLVGNTDEICRYCVENGWAPDKVAKLDNFIPAPRGGWERERAAARALHRIPGDATVLLACGRLHAVKGVDVAIRALAQLPENIWLLLAGEGPLRHELEMLASAQGVTARTVFAGWVDDVSGVAAAADIWLAPSRHEPLGNTVLDGWAHGLPVVASRVGGMAVLIDDGRTGVLVPPDDEDALAGAVRHLLNDERGTARLAAGGREKYEREFSEKVVVARWIQYYRGLMEGDAT